MAGDTPPMQAFCLSELGWSEKGARRQAELFKVYKHALVDEPVYKVFQVGG